MKTYNIMLKPASSLCNMRCRYCFYADVAVHRETPSYGMMAAEPRDALLRTVFSELSAGDRVQFIFQGGEPTLAGLPFFRTFVAKAKAHEGVSVSFSLQTNGLLIDDEWCEFLKENRFLVGLSCDLLRTAHDDARRDASDKGTLTRVLRTLVLFKRHGIDFNVLCTLTPAVARHPEGVWREITRLGIDYVQFTPCLAPEDGTSSPYALTPEAFASFYTRLFALWYTDYRKGICRSVKLFDDVVNLLLLGRPTACGMNGVCTPQLVIEADGSAYPCDFYCTDDYRLGSITDTTVSTLLASPAARAFATRKREPHALCEGCRYRTFCGGGCPRMQRSVCISEDGHRCGYRTFLENCGNTLLQLTDEIRKQLISAKNKPTGEPP